MSKNKQIRGQIAFRKTANFIWDVTDDILRVDYRPIEYGWVIILFVVLLRFDCVLKPTKDRVCAKSSEL
jgi:type I restriction enzyme M protein